MIKIKKILWDTTSEVINFDKQQGVYLTFFKLKKKKKLKLGELDTHEC